jgi:hypothetical protein
MSKRKIDEASITAMVSGFLSNQKKVAMEKDGLQRRNKAFWKVVSESVQLLEAAPKDWDKEREPDDWRQKVEFPTKLSKNISSLDDEESSFSSKDDPELEGERTPRTKSDEAEGDISPKTKNRRTASPQEIARKVHTRLALMKKRQPELYEKEFGSKTPEEQKKYKIKLALKLRADDGVKIEKGGGDTRKGGAAAAAKRQEVVSGLVNRIIDKASDFAVDPSKIDGSLSSFAHKFLGINLKDPSFAVAVLEKYRNASPEQKKQIAYAIAAKALLKPENETNLTKFMNSRLDMFPHDWMDQTEETANKQGIPSSAEDKESGLGFGAQKVDDLSFFLKKKGGDENWLDGTIAKLEDKVKKTQSALENLPAGSESMPAVKKYSAILKKTQEQLAQVVAAKDELKGKVIGRKGIGGAPVNKLFKTSPVEDITKYGDYFNQNPEEIARAKKERDLTPPSELSDIMGKVHGIGDDTELQKSEIGGEDETAHMAKPTDISAAKKDYKSKMEKFKAGQENIKSASAEHGNRPSKYVHPAGAQYEKPFDLDYKDIFKNLTDVGTFDAPKKKIPGLTMKVVKDIANRLNLRARHQYKEDGTSPEQIVDVLKKLGQYDSKNRYNGLADNLDALAPEEQWVGKELQRIFNPKRMNTKQASKEDEVSLPDAFSDYASSELEKVVANIPAREKAIEGEKQRQAGEEVEKQNRLQKFKASAPSPEEGEEIDRQRIATRSNLSSKLRDRAKDLEKERESEKDIVNTKFGDKEEFERNKRDTEFLEKDAIEDPLRYLKPSGKPEEVSDEEINKKLEKSIERLKASDPGKYRAYERMSPEQKESFKNARREELRKKTAERKGMKADRKAEVQSPYGTLDTVKKLNALKTKERSPEFLKGRQLRLTRALDAGKAKDPQAAKMQLSKIADVLPHAARARELQDLDAKRTYVPPALGPTSRPSQPGISFTKPRPEGPRPLQLPGGSVGGKRPPMMTGAEKNKAADTSSPKTSYPEKIFNIRNKFAATTMSDEEKAEKLAAIEKEEFPQLLGHTVGDTTFKYDQEDKGSFQKRLVSNLVKDARKKLAKAGSSPDDEDLLKEISNSV